jgi:hypothetical protein
MNEFISLLIIINALSGAVDKIKIQEKFVRVAQVVAIEGTIIVKKREGTYSGCKILLNTNEGQETKVVEESCSVLMEELNDHIKYSPAKSY